ncbi:Lar family restriction alleviation protein [Paraburkholderia sp. RCC_158]|uniref:Lar family restriction alleviation protein n=1 Tax=Paraburkholderia sp. RCC_158 TaxID=3239220 RepID=UPI0035239BBD
MNGQDERGAFEELRGQMNYIAAYDPDELDRMSKDRLAIRLRAIIERARRAMSDLNAASTSANVAQGERGASEPTPCPFCSSKAELSEWEEVDATRWAAQVKCSDCGAEGPKGYANNRRGCFDAEYGLHKDRALAAWNRRAAQSANGDPQ